ncbi:LysR family transcriptional regulator [Nonomuraea sp. NPDC050556]|uniref:LysR family transcriptional regulator n=1 Tax=Nonomuraea sp. NPDC050556 TaxID=3364369 RepID=UPI0037A8507A
MRVETLLLRTFVTVARLASFSAAADELGYTQSAISQQIAALEADLGVGVLTRRPVAPTPAGERLLEHAEALLLRVRAARADVRRTVSLRQTVRLACNALAVPAQALPVGAVSLTVTDAFSAVHLLASGQADLALVGGVAAPSDPLPLPEVGPLARSSVREEPVVVVMPPGHPLAGRARMGLGELVDALWIEAPSACWPLERLRALSGVSGFRVGLRLDGCDVRTLLALVAAGHGLAVLPASVAEGPQVPGLVHRVELLSHLGQAEGAVARVSALLEA